MRTGLLTVAVALATAAPAWAQLEIFNGRGPTGSSFEVNAEDLVTSVTHTISGCPDYRVTRRVLVNGQMVMADSFDVVNAPDCLTFEWLLPTAQWGLEADDVVTIHYKVQKLGGVCGGVEDLLYGDVVDGTVTVESPIREPHPSLIGLAEPRRLEALIA